MRTVSLRALAALACLVSLVDGASAAKAKRTASYQPGARAAYHPDVRKVPTGPATVVIQNGRVFTGVRGQAYQEAVAIRGDKILAVGTNAEIAKLVTKGTRVIDAEGHTVLPGMIETHGHLTDIVERAIGVQSPTVEDLRKATPIAGWIRGVGTPPKSLKEFDEATMRDGKPVPAYIESHFGSDSWVNTEAMRRARAYWSRQKTFYGRPNKTYRNPSRLPVPPGGSVDEKTGTLFYANNLFFDGRDRTGTLRSYEELGGVMPQLGYDVMREPLRLTMRYFAANGITGFHNMMATPHDLVTLGQLEADGELTTRVYSTQGMTQAKLHTMVTPQFRALMKQARLKFNSERLFTGMIKFNDSGTPISEMAGEVNKLDEEGLQAAIHTHGDMIRALERAEKRRPGSTAALRHRLEHTMGNVKTAHRIGSGGTLQFDAPRRSLLKYPKTALRHWGAGTDWDVIPDINPMNFVAEAAGSLGSIDEALHGYTSNAAWLGHSEDMVGSLEPGKKADVVILSHDILGKGGRGKNLQRARPVLTMVDGETIFQTGPKGDAVTASHEDWAEKVQRAGQDAARRAVEKR